MLWLTVKVQRIHWYRRLSDAIDEVSYKPGSTVFRSRSSTSGPSHFLHCSLRCVQSKLRLFYNNLRLIVLEAYYFYNPDMFVPC
jgi:hypothetical protein